MKSRTLLSVLIVVALAGCRHHPVEPTRYAIHASYPLPGPTHWDLLATDPAHGHVFLTRGDRVQVMNASGHLVGTIAGTAGAHGVVVVPELGRGFVTNGKSNSVTEFNLKTLARVRDIAVGGTSPDAALYDPPSRRLFVFNAHSDDASVIDPIAGREVARIAFTGNPELGASDGRGHVYVNIENTEQLATIDTASLQVVRTSTLANCDGPTGLAVDARTQRVFSACQNRVLVVTDPADGRQVARVHIGEGPDGAVFDPANGLVFVPAGKSGSLTVIHEDTPDDYSVRQILETERSARTIALDPVAHRLYLPAARLGPQPDDPNARPPVIPDSFHVLVVW